MQLTVASFYKFTPIDDGAALRAALRAVCRSHAIKGTVLIAPEGINATIAGTQEAVAAVVAHLRSDPRFVDVTVKQSLAQAPPFQRLKVKLKREIVTFGVPEASPGATPAAPVGDYVAPQDWNALVQDPDVVLLDARNAYEVAIGTFPGAIDPNTRAFSEWPAFVEAHLDPARHRKVAMFCTGGIRCEKASAYLRARGFAEVYHLRGGILAYLAAVPASESLWQGECYVFDGRVALEHGLGQGHYAMRRPCGHPVPAAGQPRGVQDVGDFCLVCAQQALGVSSVEAEQDANQRDGGKECLGEPVVAGGDGASRSHDDVSPLQARRAAAQTRP